MGPFAGLRDTAGQGLVPRVTGLGPVGRLSGWIEVELDGSTLCRLPDQDVYRLGLEVGAELAETDLQAVHLAAERAEAYRIGLRYLSVRPRSRREVELRLGRARISTATIERTLDRFGELGYLDDTAFAAALARDRIRLRPCGVQRLLADLGARGVSRGDAEAGIEAAMDEEEVTEQILLERSAAARAIKLAGADPEVAQRRLYAYLARRGFDRESVRAWLEKQGRGEEHGGA